MILIKNINIVSMIDNSLDMNKSIIIAEGIIREISDSCIDEENFEEIIEGKGKYIMPGLVNMHTHLGDNKDDLKLYLVNGVTSIRNMWGYEKFDLMQWFFGTRVFNHLMLKRQVDAGEVIGPRIFTAGPMLDGDPPFFPKFMKFHCVSSKAQIERIIKKQVLKGYDFIKVYSKLSRKNFNDIIEMAKNYKIPVVGHMPDDVGIEDTLKSGIKSIEHLYGFVNPYHPELNVKGEDIKRLANIAAENKVYNCPTLIANYRLANVGKQNQFEKEQQMKYISHKNKKAMKFLLKESDRYLKKHSLVGNHMYMDSFHKIIRELNSTGAKILLGTDKAVPYVVAGFSEHIEMKMLSEAGLNNYEVLKTATIDAAKCLGEEKYIGTVEKGKAADLIITNENPFDNLETIKNHVGIISRGVYYSKERCETILNKIKKENKN